MGAETPPEQQLDFSVARDNFYTAAHHGLEAHITWLDGTRGTARHLLLTRLLPMARLGLERLEIDVADIDRYLGIIEARVQTGQTGSVWQRAYAQQHGGDLVEMTQVYRNNQDSGTPVHQWAL